MLLQSSNDWRAEIDLSATHSQVGKKHCKQLFEAWRDSIVQLQCDILKRINFSLIWRRPLFVDEKMPIFRLLKTRQITKKWGSQPIEITELPQKKCGSPLLLGNRLEVMVKVFINASQDEGTILNTERVMGTCTAIQLLVIDAAMMQQKCKS